MSKNVAVFVDVANIFYAAKAAGIDIDYVTLLKSATANRDFVRAYAYTGLDPENENQRQFHAFLARSGYKVVSKDIRKYGDGRVKANLDIELVVDMMRLAEKLDIAIVVSGDGDFAPAITAVQQKGVRVEVISFRGNTSSDLIDVADVFIDITNVAKVEKGARSGRRIASEGDLSMTEVPDKESGVKPRRRRRSDADDKSEKGPRSARTPRRRSGRKTEAEEPEKVEAAGTAVSDPAAAAALVALPGEKLSRGAEIVEAPAEPEEAVAAESTDEAVGEEGTGRRRRRRRGGRGRGRGGRGAESADERVSDDQPSDDQPSDDALAAAAQPDEVPTLPQHSGFGSVWDSQIGVPADTAPAASAGSVPEDEEFEDEPEVPEYLLSEKKQGRGRGGRGGRNGRSGRSGGYRSAIDRERYGTGGSSYARGSSRGKGRSASTPRASAQSMEPIEQTPGGDPWSEVPPEVQELLMAEVARRDTTEAKTEAPAEDKPKKTTRKRTTTKTTAPAEEAAAEAPSEEAAEKPKKTTRKRTTTKKTAPAEEAAAEAPSEEAAEKPKKTTRKRTTTKKTAPAEEAAAEAPSEEAEEKPKKTTRKRTTKKATPAKAEAPAEEAAADAPAEEKPKKTTRKRTTKKATPAKAEAPAEEA